MAPIDPAVKRAPSLAVLLLLLHHLHGQTIFQWMKYDHFDEIDDHLRTVNEFNCHAKSREEMVLRADTVTQLPVYNQLLDRTWYPNRTSLIHLHNTALNRAFFYSYILQKMNSSETFYKQPNWLYMYMSHVADVNANPYHINGSSVYFDSNCHYPNWYLTVNFNNTIPLFAPSAWRHDDYQDQDNLLRETTRQVVTVKDMGAGNRRNYTHSAFKMNPWYTKWLPDLQAAMDSLHKYTYYAEEKYSNDTGQFVAGTPTALPFFGPASPSASDTDERTLPVVFTAPYFDCGRSNKWVVSAVSPVVDYMPRYSNWTHLRRPRIVGVVVTDLDFIEIDFNACGVSAGNPGPSYLAGIHRCKSDTGCKHKNGYGFKRGGYVCHCKAGWAYPWTLQRPFQGDNIEQATDKEYEEGFQCTRVGDMQVLPLVENLNGTSVEGGFTSVNSGGLPWEDSGKLGALWELPPFSRSKRSVADDRVHDETTGSGDSGREWNNCSGEPHGMHADIESVHDKIPLTEVRLKEATRRREEVLAKAAGRREEAMSTAGAAIGATAPRNIADCDKPHKRKKRRAVFDQQAFGRMVTIFRHIASVTGATCGDCAAADLVLPGDVAYGASTQFEAEARTGLRMAHLLSNVLQNTGPDQHFGNMRGFGRLHEDIIFGEVMASVMSDHRISSSGVFFDEFMWENEDRSRKELFGPWAYRKGRQYVSIIDRAGNTSRYTEEEWFRSAKARWVTNFQSLKTYKMRPYIRSDPQGTSSVRHEDLPVSYKAPQYKDGYWTRPHFRCDSMVNAWVVTYVVPFFGHTSRTSEYRKLQFKGVVTIDVPLHLLEINQCPQSFGVANAFKNTARCDYLSTWCRPQQGFPFTRGAYRCDCLQGFEYWHRDGKFWIEGSLLELEHEKKIRGYFNRFDQLVCRVSKASGIFPFFTITVVGLMFYRILS